MGLAPTPTPWSSCCSHTTAAAAAAAALLLAIPSSNPVLRRHRSLGRRPPPRRLRLILAASASPPAYNGWGELPDASPFSFPLLLFQEEKKDGLLLLLLPLLVVVPASAAALSRLPPLPLLVAAFTAGFVARHLASFSPQPSSSALILAPLADLDAQVRALRDHLTAAAVASSRPQPVVVLDAVDRLRDAVLHATRLARHDTTAPTLAPLGELADSVAAWARDTLRDLTSSTRNKPKDLDSKPKVSSPPVQQDASGSATQDMLPFHTDDNDDDDGALEEDATTRTRTSRNSDLELERLLLKHRRTGSSSSMESRRTLEIRDRSYYRLNIECEKSHVSEAQEQVDPFSAAAATDSDCQEFSSNMKEAAEILKKARECMVAGADEEEAADALLYRSARLLSAAVALRPTSLVAVGQLGNTYLLHGELKLKVSRELRTLLANTGAALLNGRDPVPRSRKVNSTAILNRENISAALVDVCEECESLLVEAGRSYRTALSIDPADVKALYNWGLALIFRAQLLADIGPEAAVDADRVYLAAIDKFDAMLSKSNTYAPEALYRWGTALQQRSQLRPRNNREKIRLLEQAKSLFEDVLYVEADNKMVREALASCISELNYHGRWI